MEWVRDTAWLKFIRKWLGFSLLMHLVAAVMSVGYFDVDEHFQILEFLNARLGRSPFTDLAWEFPFRNRPWLQPMFFEVPTRLLMAVGIHDPFVWTTVMRVIVALIGWASLAGLAYCCYFWFEERKWKEWSVRLLCLFWFAPFLHARTSSENLGGSLFVFALVCFELYPRIKARVVPSLVLTGVFLGLSFMVRFQMGFAHAAFGLWLVTVGRVRDWTRLGALALGFVSALGFAVILDRFGYGEWVLTPWAYFVENILRGHAASFGTSPWTYYAQNLWEVMPPLGALLLIGSVLGWVRRPWHLLSFTSALFFLGNTVVAHKESRFLFPMALEMPVVVVLGLQGLRWPAKVIRPLAGLLYVVLAIDVSALLVLAFKPALAQIHFYEAVYRHSPPVQELWHGTLDPYSPFKLRMNYYFPAGMKEREYKSLSEVERSLRPDQDLWLFYENFELTGEAAVLAPHCQLDYTTFPEWLKNFTFLPGPRKFANRWSLYRCRQ